MQNTTERKLPAPSVSAVSTLAYPIMEGFERLGIGPVKGYQIVNAGQLETYRVGSRRYVTEAALQKFINMCIAKSVNESHADRAGRVEKAVAGRARQRDAQVTA